MTAEQELMVHVRAVCGSWIEEAAAGTAYTPEFLAALTANESGGNPLATRLEPAVYADLSQVYLGKKPDFGAIGGEDMQKFFPAGYPTTATILQILHWATSWGPTQIMGYESLARGYALSQLASLDRHYLHAIELLDDFRERWHLVPGAWAALFDCWNTGRPNGETADKDYTPNGLARMEIYRQLPPAGVLR